MTLVPAFTDAEQLLLRGPQPLRAYSGESFGWVRGLLAPAARWDWNMLLTANARMRDMPDRLRRLSEFYRDLAAPERPYDAKDPVIVATDGLTAIADAVDAATVVTHSAADARWDAVVRMPVAAAADADVRAMQEWEAWIVAMERHAHETARIIALLRRNHKRGAPDDAEPPPPPKEAPVVVEDE